MSILHAVYLKDDGLKNSTLLVKCVDGQWYGQFDNLTLPRSYTHNWVPINREDFIIDDTSGFGEDWENL